MNELGNNVCKYIINICLLKKQKQKKIICKIQMNIKATVMWVYAHISKSKVNFYEN